MHRPRYHRTLFAALLSLGMLGLSSCSDDTTNPPATSPDASFTVSGTAQEGSAMKFTNTSTNATSYSWYSVPAGLTSTSKDSVVFKFDSAGTYTVYLVATGNGKSDTASKTVTVLENRMWHATGDSAKVWKVVSLTVGGSETAALPCHKDNTITFAVEPTMTFELSEGADVCPSSAQVLPPQSGTWSTNAGMTQITLNVTKPFAQAVTYDVKELTKSRAVGEATLPSLGKVVLTLEAQ